MIWLIGAGLFGVAVLAIVVVLFSAMGEALRSREYDEWR
jgi:hypothetical protein